MFDNEIDWVTCSKSWPVRREARRPAQDFEHDEYKAEHKPRVATYPEEIRSKATSSRQSVQ